VSGIVITPTIRFMRRLRIRSHVGIPAGSREIRIGSLNGWQGDGLLPAASNQCAEGAMGEGICASTPAGQHLYGGSDWSGALFKVHQEIERS